MRKLYYVWALLFLVAAEPIEAETMESLEQGTAIRLKIVPASEPSTYSWLAGDIVKMAVDTLVIKHADNSVSAVAINGREFTY